MIVNIIENGGWPASQSTLKMGGPYLDFEMWEMMNHDQRVPVLSSFGPGTSSPDFLAGGAGPGEISRPY
jgi:hypothetical protein